MHGHSQSSTPLVENHLIQLSSISDQLDIVASLKDSIYFDAISELSSIYEKKLVLLHEVFSKLIEVQRRWLHLERIYRSGAMLLQQNDFDKIDSLFQKIMKRNENSLLKHLVDERRNPNMEKVLSGLLHDIEECQRNLSTFIESKRNAFPRLNFIGDESVVQLLGSSKQPKSIQMHLKHLFQGINSVVFDNDFNSFIAFRSMHSEEVKLSKVCH